MRIVGGKHRGRRIAAPPGDTVRPTSERAREALFNILAHGRFATAPVFEPGMRPRLRYSLATALGKERGWQ